MKEKVKEYKELIEKKDKINIQLKEMKKTYTEKVNKYKEEENLDQLNADIEKLKKELTKLGLAEYKLTENKSLYGGLKINVTNIFKYTIEDALEWAKEHNLCLQLDEKAFKSIIKVQNIDCVTKSTEDIVTFPKVIKLEE